MNPIVWSGSVVQAPGALEVVGLGPIPLVELTTETGQRLCCAAETVLAIRSSGGHASLLLPRAPSSVVSLESVLLDHAFKEARPYDPRLWYLAGLMLANGKVTGNPARPARILLKGERASAVCDLVAMLHALGSGQGSVDGWGKPYRVIVKEHHGGVDVSSALLDRVNAWIGDFIEPVTMRPRWERLLPAGDDAFHAFMAGLVRGMAWAEGAAFVHRSADVVRFVHHRLYTTFGVPSRLSISPHEPETVTHKARTTMPHRLVISAPDLCRLVSADLWPAGRPRPAAAVGSTYAVAITRVVAIGTRDAVALVSPDDTVIVVDDFLLHTRFDPQGGLALATMRELFVPEPVAPGLFLPGDTP